MLQRVPLGSNLRRYAEVNALAQSGILCGVLRVIFFYNRDREDSGALDVMIYISTLL